MMDKNIPLELIKQLEMWVNRNVSRPAPSSSVVELREVNNIIAKFKKMSLDIPPNLLRRHDELEAIVNEPNEHESFLHDLSERLSSLSRDIKRRIGSQGSGTRAPAKRLRVRLPDGRYVCEGKAVDTFIEVLKFMGLAKCAEVESVIQFRYPVVANRPNNNEDLQPGNIKEVGGYYIETKTSTETKAKQLEEYAEELQIKIQVDVID